MATRTVLITGGAGFIGASLALELTARHPDWEIVALDNLHRRGSELNLPRLREHGVRFVHGDVREPSDLRAAGVGLPTVVNRCGVVAGPWQMGKVDQGVFTHWMLAFHFKRPLSYIGFGGAGKQVRDLLHVADLAELVDDQLSRPQHWAGAVVNVGGGVQVSLSLRETSALCEEITGNSVQIASNPATRVGDVPLYISDCRKLERLSDWTPRRDARQILLEIHTWLCEHERAVAAALSQ
jgi:CDP-paratose 2-epimerase